MKLLSVLSTLLLSGMVMSAAVPAIPADGADPVPAVAPTPDETGGDIEQPWDDDGAAVVITGDVPAAPQAVNGTGADAELAKRQAGVARLEFKKDNWHAGSVTGSHFIELFRNGNVHYKTRFHNSGVLQYRYAHVCWLKDAHSPARAYTFARGAKLGGVLGPSRTHSQDVTAHKAAVASNWQSIVAGEKVMHCRVRVQWALLDALNDVINLIRQLLGAAVQIYRLFQ